MTNERNDQRTHVGEITGHAQLRRQIPTFGQTRNEERQFNPDAIQIEPRAHAEQPRCALHSSVSPDRRSLTEREHSQRSSWTLFYCGYCSCRPPSGRCGGLPRPYQLPFGQSEVKMKRRKHSRCEAKNVLERENESRSLQLTRETMSSSLKTSEHVVVSHIPILTQRLPTFVSHWPFHLTTHWATLNHTPDSVTTFLSLPFRCTCNRRRHHHHHQLTSMASFAEIHSSPEERSSDEREEKRRDEVY